MIDSNEVPYGALYSLQPEYLAYLIHDEIHHEGEEVETPATIEMYIKSMMDFLTKS